MAGVITASGAKDGAGTNGVSTPGAATGGAASNLYYRTLYDWTLDTPGSYSLTVVFTVVSP